MSGFAWTPGPTEASRCTESVLMQFGIFGRRPRNGLGLLEALQTNGWTYRCAAYLDERVTVRRFVEAHPTGRFYLATDGHAMALIDGLLVDSAERGVDGRHLIGAFEVYRKEEAA